MVKETRLYDIQHCFVGFFDYDNTMKTCEMVILQTLDVLLTWLGLDVYLETYLLSQKDKFKNGCPPIFINLF